MVNFMRRFRVIPIQFVLAAAALVIYLIARHNTPKRDVEAKWGQFRDEELKKYATVKEVGLEFLRKAGHVGSKIEDLGEKDLDKMNLTQLMVAVHSFMDNTDVICRRRIRMGSLSDGGFEICDDELIRPKQSPCLVYSFSSTENFAFEDDISRVYRCEVHSFRVEMEFDDFNRSDLVYVHPFGVGKYTEDNPEGKELYTFGDIRTILSHKKRNIDVVKLDIHYSEWSALQEMIEEDELDNVRQVLVEYHIGTDPTEDKLRRMLRILRGMSEAGFRKFYVHKCERGVFHHPNFPVVRSKCYDIHYLNENFLKKEDKKRKLEEEDDDEEEDEEEEKKRKQEDDNEEEEEEERKKKKEEDDDEEEDEDDKK